MRRNPRRQTLFSRAGEGKRVPGEQSASVVLRVEPLGPRAGAKVSSYKRSLPRWLAGPVPREQRAGSPTVITLNCRRLLAKPKPCGGPLQRRTGFELGQSTLKRLDAARIGAGSAAGHYVELPTLPVLSQNLELSGTIFSRSKQAECNARRTDAGQGHRTGLVHRAFGRGKTWRARDTLCSAH
jgi:hypothetical protein